MRRSISSSASGLEFDLHPQARGALVHQIDGLVRQEAVGDVAIRQLRRRDEGGVRNPHLVVLFVLLLQAAQDRDRVLDRRLGDEHRLESTGERGVLLDVLAVLVERRRADAVQLAAGERRLQEVRRVHRAVRLARADEGVHLVDEQDDAAGRGRHFGEDGLQPLLELAAILRPGDHRTEVERHQLLVAQRFRHVAIDDPERQAFRDRGLADAGLADQHGIVLGAAGQDLDGAADLVVAADHRVKLAFAGRRRQVAGVLLQRLVAALGRRGVGSAALADLVDRLVEPVRRDAGLLQDVGGLRRLLDRHGEQQPLDRHVAVAGLLGDLLGGGEDLRERLRQIHLRTAAGDLRHRVERRVDRQLDLLRAPAGALDQAGRHPLLVVDEGLQKVLGRKLLVVAPDRQRLRGLDEAADPFGVFFQIHRVALLSANHP